MDFQQLMMLASQNQMKAEKKLPSTKKYSTEVSAPKKLQKVRAASDVVKKLRKEKVQEKLEKERNDINDHITERIKEQKRREDALRDKKIEKMRSKVHHDREKSKVRIDKQIERAKDRRENVDEKYLTPKMKEKLKEERLREKLREIKLKDKQEIQLTTEGMTAAESKKEGFKIPKSGSDGPKASLSNEKSVKSSTSIVSAGARPLYKISVSNQLENSSKTATKKPVTKGPPPLDFNSLMKLASKKASDPKAVTAVTTPNTKNLNNRPMTQDEKERLQRMTSKQFKEWYKYGTSPERSESPTENLKKSGGDKVRKKETIDLVKKDKKTSDYFPSEKKRQESMNGDHKRKASTSDTKVLSKSKNEDDLADKYKILEQKYKALEEKLKQKESAKEKASKSFSQKSSSSSSSSNHTTNSQNRQTSSKSSGKYTVENNNLLICRPAEKEPEKPTSAWDRIYNQIQKSNPVKKPVKRKRVIDSDEEDEEMADFIDDEPIEDEYSSNYSKCIREIFGYDRRKFQEDDDDDDDNMETSFAQQMKEEIRSTKIGILEDLEDIRLEKEQKKKKAKLKT